MTMRNFELANIDRDAFDALSASHPQGNYQQTSAMGDVRVASGVEVSYVGVLEDGALVAASMLEVHRSRLSTFAEVHDGPLCDLEDAELTRFLFDGLKARARAAGAAQLAITPELPYRGRDTNGRPLPQEGSDEPWPDFVPVEAPAGKSQVAFDNLLACGFVHEGFDTAYNAVPRWRYVKDLTGITNEQELLESYAKHTRRNLRIVEASFVTVERVGRDQLKTFHDVCELSCEKQGFENRPVEYFELLYDHLGDDAEFYIAFIDCAALMASVVEKRDEFAAEIRHLRGPEDEEPRSKKARRKLADVTEKYEGQLKRIERIQAFLDADGERIPAAGALFVRHPREYVYLFSGSNPVYAEYCAATALQHHAMCRCLEEGVTRYNLYGINGVFDDPKDPGRGLLWFKQGFNGYVEEMMGSFTLTVKPVAFAIKRLAHKVLGR